MSSFYSTAIVTGASGFIGRHLVQRLLSTGVCILAGDCVPWPYESHANLTFQQFDINSSGDLEIFCKNLRGVDGNQVAVFHMAGQAHNGLCRQNPIESAALNVLTPLSIFETCRNHEIENFVFPSTGLVYGAHAVRSYKESDPVSPASMYAASKLAAENLLQAYSAEFGLRCAVARLANVYGCGASKDSVVSLLLNQVIKRQDVTLKTFKPLRDFIYVGDVVDALIALSQTKIENSFEIYNVGTGVSTSIGELALLACNAADYSARFLEADSNGLEKESKTSLDIGKLTKNTPWRPCWTLSDGIKKTLDLMARE